jgi:hypothetical protein
LKRIESQAFSYSSFELIVIARSVRSHDDSRFSDVNLLSILIASDHSTFVVPNGLFMDAASHNLIYDFSK